MQQHSNTTIDVSSDNKPVNTYQIALEQSTNYFNGNELAAKVFVDKYALRNTDGELLEFTPRAMHERLATEFARIDFQKYGLNYDERYNVYFGALDKFARIVPQGSPMAAIGNKWQRMSASNCVVVASPNDSISGILSTGLELAQLYKRRCGVGLDISTLRPDGAAVNNSARTTSGAWSFADYYSYITRMIGQSGRRGALMITLDVHHPDVIKFATMKHDLTKVTGANVSLRLSNEFLTAVENDTEYELRWPCNSRDPLIKKRIRAKEVWDIVIDSATKTAEPGLIMWDNMLDNLPAHCYPEFKTISTNPCSEIALSAYDSCRLISLNLTGYVCNPFTEHAKFNYSAFGSDVRIAMQMADNLVDLELELIDRIRDVCEPGAEKDLWTKLYNAGSNGRRTGLGTHGLADTLAQLCVRYDSSTALLIVDNIYKTLRDEAYDTSIELAKVRGSFPVYDFEKEKSCQFINRLPALITAKMQTHGRRNISLLTQAPTGSVSILSKIGSFDNYNVSSGVEPVFRNYYTRRKKINANDGNARVDFVDVVGDKWQEFKIFHGNVQNYLAKLGLSENISLPDFFVTSDEINWERRVKIQAIEQQYIDHSISSTINLPAGTSSTVVGNLYLEGWKSGLKGVTVYVDGSRDGVLVTENKAECESVPAKEKSNGKHEDKVRFVPKRPAILPSETHKIRVDFGDGIPKNAYMTVSFFEDSKRPYEIFIVAPYQGLEEKDLQILELAARSTSMMLRHGIPIRFICEQLDRTAGQYIFSIPTNISKILRQYDDNQSVDIPKINIEKSVENKIAGLAKCPSCNKRSYVLSGGCGSCTDCGYSGCN